MKVSGRCYIKNRGDVKSGFKGWLMCNSRGNSGVRPHQMHLFSLLMICFASLIEGQMA